MLYEVELKFPLNTPAVVLARLADIGATALTPIEQRDRYFNHPARDFSVTDEAFRLRSVGTSNCVTYKGPVVDRATKMRHEIEVAIADGPDAATQMTEIWTALGFRFVHEVHKVRTPWHLTWDQQDYELALDDVSTLGTFLEIELIADEAHRESAKAAILKLSEKLQLSDPERRSYLEMVMSKAASPGE